MIYDPVKIQVDGFDLKTAEEKFKVERDMVRKFLDLSLIPPEINTSPSPEYSDKNLIDSHCAGIERTENGRLWCVFNVSEDGPSKFFVLVYSDDDGETWSDTKIVINNHSQYIPVSRAVECSCIWKDPLNRFWIFFNQMLNGCDGRFGVWVSCCSNPDEENPKWSFPKRIWHGVACNKPIVLSTGEWMLAIDLYPEEKPGGPYNMGGWVNKMIFPGMHTNDTSIIIEKKIPVIPLNAPWVWGLFPELEPYRGTNIFISKDQGATWAWQSVIKIPEHLNPDQVAESMIVEKKDKSLWFMGRTMGNIVESFSTDRGITWSSPIEQKHITHPRARFHLRRLSSGRILLIKHGETINNYDPQYNGRNQLSAWLSEDEGISWKGGLMLDERFHVSYPDATQSLDGTIYTVNDWDRGKLGQIVLSGITEEDILAGKLVSSSSKLKIVIRPRWV